MNLKKGQERILKLFYAVEDETRKFGRNGATAQGITKAAGTSNTSAIQYFFGTKDKLINEVVQFRMSPLVPFYKKLEAEINKFKFPCDNASKDQEFIFKYFFIMAVTLSWSTVSAFPKSGYMTTMRHYPEILYTGTNSKELHGTVIFFEEERRKVSRAVQRVKYLSDEELFVANGTATLMLVDGCVFIEFEMGLKNEEVPLDHIVMSAILFAKMLSSGLGGWLPSAEELDGLYDTTFAAISKLGKIDFVGHSLEHGFLKNYSN
jgi:AcrR family transcriptional regulator